MELIDRNFCVLSGNKNLEDLPGLKKFPFFMGCVTHESKYDKFVEMKWGIEYKTGLIQLKKLIPLDVLYENSHGSGSIGNIWTEHHKSFAKFIHSISPHSVLEVGGAHGILSIEHDKISKIPWTIIEPDPHPAKDCKAIFIKGFFDNEFQTDSFVDTLVHSHVFEHIYYPNDFMSYISSFLKQDQNLVFSIPNLEVMLRKKYTNAINFEHTVFLTEPYIEFLLAKNHFRVLKKEYFLSDHSIFYACVKDENIKPFKLREDLYEKNKAIYMEYINFYNNLILSLNKKIESYAKSHSIYLFGAHIFSQHLIINGLNTKDIKYILDNDKEKQNKRLYGTNIKVASPKSLQKDKFPIVILKAGVYNNEIKNQILNDINKDTIFWE